MTPEIKRYYEFRNFRFDAEKKVLWSGDRMVALSPKASDVLGLLIESRGNLVERQEILEKVWPDTFVEEGVLNNAISSLRKVLGEKDVIQTVPRRGYRFSGEVREVFEDGGHDDALIIEKRTVSQTLIDERDEVENESEVRTIPDVLPVSKKSYRTYLASALLTVALLTAGAIWYFRGDVNENGVRANADSTKTLAVLPFQSLADEDDKALGAGIGESLVSRLGSTKKIIVRPIKSVSRLAETESDPLEIGRKLRADFVMEGSFQRSGGRIRLNVRLLNVQNGLQVWSDSFDEIEQDVFKIQDSLSARAAQYLIERLSPQEQTRLAARPTEDFEAYKLYLRGRHFWNKRTREGFAESIRLYQAAIDRDPTFALAFAGLADSYVLLNDYDAAAPAEAYPKAKAAALRALEIQPDLIEPRTTLAYVLASYDWNFPEAEREYRRVIEANPNYATAHQWYGEMLYATKRFAEAEIELKRAAELDPLVPIIQSEIGIVLYYSGRYDEAIAHYAKLKQEFPSFPSSYLFSSWSYEQKGMLSEAFADEMVFWKLQGVDEATLREMERAFREEGHTAYLRRLANMLERAVKAGSLFHDYRLVHVYGRLRDREKVFEWLERGVKNRSSNINKVYLDPNFDFLRSDARFQEFLAKMNLQ